MAYSSFIRTEMKAGKYDILQALLNPARYGSAEAYLLQVRKVNGIDISQDPRIRGVIEMSRSVDIIVIATLEDAKDMATAVHRKVSQPVGIAKYRKDEGSIEAHTQAGIARDIAEEENKESHFYDPTTDSLETSARQ